jgi:D-3-phosphoglycerate dehydrogenase
MIKANNYFPISFDEGIKIADFISVHLPLNEKTKYLITKKELSKMKKTCIIVNTARGGIIKEEDLFWALKNNVIHSAGLDVFEQEPPKKNDPLFALDNLILSPHSAALTLECRKRMAVETCSNILYYLNRSSDLILSNIVNKDILN